MKNYIIILNLSLFSFNIHTTDKLLKTVYIIGSSHASFSYRFIRDVEFVSIENIPVLFKIRSYPGISMYRIASAGLECLNLDKFDIKTSDIVVFLFGSMDCSFLIGKQIDKYKRDVNEVIDTLLIKFFEHIMTFKKFNPEITLAIHEIIPPSTCGYGSIEERCSITKLFNKRLNELCHEHNLIFINIYDLCADENGVMLANLYYDCIHINPELNKPLKERLIKILSNYKKL